MMMFTRRILAGLLLAATTIDQGVMAGFAGQVEYENLIEDSFSNSASLDNVLRAIAQEAKLFEMQKRYQDARDEQMYEVSAKMDMVALDEFDDINEKVSDPVGWEEGDEGTNAVQVRHLGATEAPFGATFVLRALGDEDSYMAGILDGRAPLKMEPCLHQESNSVCGGDACVSLVARASIDNETHHRVVPFTTQNSTNVTVVDMYLRKVGDQVKWLEVEDEDDAKADSSFCLRPGYASSFSIGLEPVTDLGKMVQQDVDSNFLVTVPEGDVSDDYASFRLLQPGTTCRHGSDCPGKFFCHKDSCYPKRDKDQLCDQSYHCKSGHCKLDRVGNLIDGFFIRICSEPPTVE